MKRPPFQFGMCDAERDMIDAARRGRNCALGIIATLVVGYVVLMAIGGPA